MRQERPILLTPTRPTSRRSLQGPITEGFEPDGEPMDLTMPRWQMSERDLDDLLEFLKTLD